MPRAKKTIKRRRFDSVNALCFYNFLAFIEEKEKVKQSLFKMESDLLCCFVLRTLYFKRSN